MIAKHPGECRPHEYQDAKYGKGFRVMNPVAKKSHDAGARCTVCSPPKVKGTKRGGIYPVSELQVKRG